MLEKLLELLSHIFQCSFTLLPKTHPLPQKKKIFSLDATRLLVVECDIPYASLMNIKKIIDLYVHLEQSFDQMEQKTKLLEEELLSILQSEKLFFQSDGNLKKFFLFLQKPFIRYALIEQTRTIINSGIDPFTLATTKEKLKKVDEFSLPIKNGELYATKIYDMMLIIDSRHPLDEFFKKIARSRLLLLFYLFEAQKGVAIDSLTGAYTRRKFLQDISSLEQYAFLFINLKDFKTINDIYSSALGDKLLQEVVLRAKEVFGNENVYRVYGDRFAFVLSPQDDALKLLQKVFRPFILTNTLTEREVLLEVEYQAVLFQKKCEEMLQKAMNVLKKIDKQFIIFEEEGEPLLHSEQKRVTLLLQALEKDAIIPYFQKIVHRDAKTYYYEALLRIQLDGKLYTPGQFLQVAKDKGLYHKLNLIMIRKILNIVHSHSIRVSINIDIYDILQKSFLPTLKELITTIHIDPTYLQFEILETENIYQYLQETLHFIKQIKELGCRIALDDFGKGYSNFSLLKDLPIDAIKLDKTLIESATTSQKGYILLQKIAQMFENLQIATVAEGIGDKKTYEKIKNLPLTSYQGFFFHKPAPIGNIL